jgi:21S rRNA (GM2251-2'-O)-methyltransferase
MLQPCFLGIRVLRIQPHVVPRTFCRYKSLTSAIERGRWSSQRDQSHRPTRDSRFDNRYDDNFRGARQNSRGSILDPKGSLGTEAIEQRSGYKERSRAERQPWQQERRVERQEYDQRPRRTERRGNNGYDRDDRRNDRPSRSESSSHSEKLPYSTAASEFIYGHSSAFAALKADRRKFYKLYVHSRTLNNNARRKELLQLARDRGVHIEEVGDEYLPILDRTSQSRPHNVRES